MRGKEARFSALRVIWKTVEIPAEEAYGPRHDQLVFEVGMDQLPPGVEAGAQLVGPDQRMVVVKEIKGDKAVIDANHFLAGKTLIFEIELVSIH